MSSSCSFRITRTAEDIAQTITALSQRLVKLEQRLEAMELDFSKTQQDPPAEEIEILDGVENLLRECKELLDTSENSIDETELWSEEEDTIAA